MYSVRVPEIEKQNNIRHKEHSARPTSVVALLYRAGEEILIRYLRDHLEIADCSDGVAHRRGCQAKSVARALVLLSSKKDKVFALSAPT